jgi:hypothetical protein
VTSAGAKERRRRRASAAHGAPAASQAGGRAWAYRLVRNTVLWLLPVALAWTLLTPPYNRFLRIAGQNLLKLVERPDVTRLYPRDEHMVLIGRLDFPPQSEVVSSFRLTDLHFPVILLAALFLAVPGVPWRERLSNLGVALVVTALFHLVLVLFWVKFVYATQLGDWSLEHYGALARNFWGLGKHLLDLPVKLALPLLLWAGFYVDRLLPKAVE